MQGNLLYRFGFAPKCKQYLLCQRLAVQQKCGAHRQIMDDHLSIPPKPKRPLIPFFRYLIQVRPTIIKENPGVKSTEVSKIAAQQWINVDSELKEKLDQEYKDDLVIFAKLKEEYNKNLTPGQKYQLDQEKICDMEEKEERRIKKKSEKLGRPKHPLPAFTRYYQSRLSEVSKYPTAKDFAKEAGKDWKNLSPDIKAKYDEERKQDYKKWQKELEEWEAKMIKEGHLDVVRNSVLRSKKKRKEDK